MLAIIAYRYLNRDTSTITYSLLSKEDVEKYFGQWAHNIVYTSTVYTKELKYIVESEGVFDKLVESDKNVVAAKPYRSATRKNGMTAYIETRAHDAQCINIEDALVTHGAYPVMKFLRFFDTLEMSVISGAKTAFYTGQDCDYEDLVSILTLDGKF